jgi:hypothetical protein
MCVRKVAFTSEQSTEEAFVRGEMREDKLSISGMRSLEPGVKIERDGR